MSTTTGTDTGTGKTSPGPAGRPTFIPTSSGRRTKALIAKLLVTLCFVDRARAAAVGALRGHHQGRRPAVIRHVVDPLPAGCPARAVRRRRLSRHLRHARPGVHRRDHRRAARVDGRHLPRRVRPGPSGPGDDLPRRRALRHPVDRRGPVRLQRLDHHTRLRAERIRRVVWRWSCSCSRW